MKAKANTASKTNAKAVAITNAHGNAADNAEADAKYAVKRNTNAKATDVPKTEDDVTEKDKATAGDDAEPTAKTTDGVETHAETGNESEAQTIDEATAGG